MEMSRRITGLTGGGSDGWDVYYKANAMTEAGHDITHLTIGEHDIGTDRSILEAMHAATLAGHTGYPALNGRKNLRETIASRVTDRTGVTTTPDNVLVVPGGQAGLFATHAGACDDGDRALYIDPYYATYPGTIRGVGAVAIPVAAKPEHGFLPQPDDIAAEAAQGASSLLINSPNNPTGVVYPMDTMDAIARVVMDHDMWLISDEVYDTQVWNGPHISPRTLPDMTGRTLVVGSMSKSHAMTGSRIGWIIGPEEAIYHMGNLSTHTTYGVAGFVQEAAHYALNKGEAFEADIAAPFLRRRDLVLDMIAGTNAIQVIPPDGAMYVMLDLRATGLSGMDFAMRLLEDHHVAVMPGESFGQAAAGHVRVGLTVDDERLVGAMGSIIELVTELTV